MSNNEHPPTEAPPESGKSGDSGESGAEERTTFEAALTRLRDTLVRVKTGEGNNVEALEAAKEAVKEMGGVFTDFLEQQAATQVAEGATPEVIEGEMVGDTVSFATKLHYEVSDEAGNRQPLLERLRTGRIARKLGGAALAASGTVVLAGTAWALTKGYDTLVEPAQTVWKNTLARYNMDPNIDIEQLTTDPRIAVPAVLGPAGLLAAQARKHLSVGVKGLAEGAVSRYKERFGPERDGPRLKEIDKRGGNLTPKQRAQALYELESEAYGRALKDEIARRLLNHLHPEVDSRADLKLNFEAASEEEPDPNKVRAQIMGEALKAHLMEIYGLKSPDRLHEAAKKFGKNFAQDVFDRLKKKVPAAVKATRK